HDQGHGIPKDVREKIFEPYFTTKPREKGTGLGLATSCGIVASVGGGIWFDTEIGEGTTFYVALPTTTREPTVHRPREGRLDGRRAKVLVVEDDTKIRDLVARLLRSRDINTITAEGAAGARRLWSSEGGFDLIIADIILPETNGIELVNELLDPSDNDVPVLFLSGYTGEVLDESKVVPNQVRFFKKPFTPDILRQAVLEMLGLDNQADESE
ncbi:MAG: response regulator, partial [Myxococcota bacterium]